MERYLVALGSNIRHRPHGDPRGVIRSAMAALGDAAGITVLSASPILASAPLGPSRRRFANAAVVVASRRRPPEMLDLLQATERRFGRRRSGRRWGARKLDLDIILWSGGCFASPRLVIPHPEFRRRDFVLAPASRVAPGWRDPVSGLTLRQLHARLTRSNPLPRARAWSGP